MKMSPSYGKQSAVGNNLRQALAANRTSCTDLAELLGVHLTSVYYWRYRGVSSSHVNDVANLLNVSPSFIKSKRSGGRKTRKKTQQKRDCFSHELSSANSLPTLTETSIEFPTLFQAASKNPTTLTGIDEPVTIVSSPRKINIDLINLVIRQDLTEQQEEIIVTLASNFVEENVQDDAA